MVDHLVAGEPGGDLDVDALLQGYLRLFRRRGGRLLGNHEAIEIGRAGSGWEVRTADASFGAPVVVNAAGGWAGEIAAAFGERGRDLGELAAALGILDEDEGVAQRATFIVDPDDVVRFIYVTDLDVGRNPEEVLRVLDALQTGELCPCNWQQGQETLKVA